ncbi:hypothetical protein SESBI_44458 [Sesbania bispinosa]|nr:hypothetical protein SESBI_44458 [Sesbania bispinosa]
MKQNQSETELHGLPLEMMSTANAAKIMGKVGEVQEVENPFVGDHLIRTFIRVKTLIDINKPLSTGCWVPRKAVALSAMNRGNVRKKIMESSNPSNPKFGPKLGVPSAKTITSLMKEQGLWRKAPASTMEENAENQPMKMNPRDRTPHGDHKDHSGTTPHLTSASFPTFPSVVSRNQNDETTNPTIPVLHTLDPTIEKINPSPTTMDLKEGRPRPGLGPTELAQMQIAKEFIGLKNPVVILDYPSPNQGKYEGAKLSEVNIKKCKMAIKERSPDLGYFVEFPEDDSEEQNNPLQTKTNPLTMMAEEEKQLIVGWNNSLSLKRKRPQEEIQNQEVTYCDVGRQDKAMKFSPTITTLDPVHYAVIFSEQKSIKLLHNIKAEEAGQSMPPPQP